MAGGWTHDGGVLDQIEDTVSDGVSSARARLPAGQSLLYCTACGEDIPEARRRALPGCKTCIDCQADRDKQVVFSSFNRRGSKDSQLR